MNTTATMKLKPLGNAKTDMTTSSSYAYDHFVNVPHITDGEGKSYRMDDCVGKEVIFAVEKKNTAVRYETIFLLFMIIHYLSISFTIRLRNFF